MSTIIIKNSGTPGNQPASLNEGELAINTADGKIFYGSTGGVKEFAGGGGTINTGSLATTGSNTFKGDQIISGSLTVTGSTYLTGLTTATQTNVVGIDANGQLYQQSATAASVFPFTGSAIITGSIVLTGSILVTQSAISTVDYIDFSPNKYDTVTPGVTPTHTEGRLFYDTGSQTLCMYNNEADVTLNIGQESWLRARNQTGVTITNGSVVKLSGAVGNRPTVTLAQAIDQVNTFSTTNDIIGMATHDIEQGTDGFITTFGLVNGVNTAAFTAGDLLWVSSSAGQYTNVAPSAPIDKTFVGVVTRANVTNGSIFVFPQQPIHFHDLSSVSASGTYNQGQLWMFKASGSSGVWTNTNTLSGSYTLSGSLTTNDGVSVQTLTASIVSASSFTGSLYGTATTASYVTGSIFTNNNSAASASYAQTASYVLNAVSSSFATNALTSSRAIITNTTTGTTYYPTFVSESSGDRAIRTNSGSLLYNADTNTMTVTASWATDAVTASYISPTFISASAAASGFGSGGSTTVVSGSNTTASFTNQSTWTFNHNTGNRFVIVKTLDTSFNEIIPQNIALTNANTATITFTTNTSGYAIASLGGTSAVTATAVNYQATPADPTGTTSLTGVMMGLAGSITPTKSGIVMIVVSGDVSNNTNGAGAQIRLRHGTGTAPSNAAALTGTAVGGLINYVPTSGGSGGTRIPFSLNAVVSGLTVSTAAWIDVSLGALTGGTATIKNTSISAFEL